jgi:hypothetical protein
MFGIYVPWHDVVPFWFPKYDFVNSKRKCFVFHNLPRRASTASIWLVSILTCRLIKFDYRAILVFYKFGLVNSKTQCGLRDSLWEKIYVFHDLPRHASTATISLDLAIPPSCRFSLGLTRYKGLEAKTE